MRTSSTYRYDEEGNRRRVAELRLRGVEVWGPERVYIDPEVPLDRVEPGAILIQARVHGQRCYISSGSVIGTSGTAVLENSQIGEGAELGAGSYCGATLLAGAKVRGFAEIRPGTLVEEEAEVAHNVGLKNTIFTVAVVAGSNINFCDAFVTGGTSRQDHSEIGSGAVHFNFSPQRDKFGSLFGDATGVLLRSTRIFIGGNSGIVAPVTIAFGAVIPAGMVVRSDVAARQVHSSSEVGGGNAVDRGLRRKLLSTAKLVGNLHALALWYRDVRSSGTSESEGILFEAAAEQIHANIAHRVREVDGTLGRIPINLRNDEESNHWRKEQQYIITRRDDIQRKLTQVPSMQVPKVFLDEYKSLRAGRTHIASLRALSDSAASLAMHWLTEVAVYTELAIHELLD
jgi:bifunctional UDP-N-acetylglucosamine pyrophosphorylase/glucosamine-1-phosphate N-acetyltransferase